MRNAKRSSNGHNPGPSAENGKSDLVKSTYLLDRTLKDNLALAAFVTRQGQSDIVREGIIMCLKEMGYDDPTKPTKLPKPIANLAEYQSK